MVVETEVDERTPARASRIDETQLIEAHIGFVTLREIFGILLRHKSERHAGRRFAIQTETGRVGRDGRQVCA